MEQDEAAHQSAITFNGWCRPRFSGMDIAELVAQSTVSSGRCRDGQVLMLHGVHLPVMTKAREMLGETSAIERRVVSIWLKVLDVEAAPASSILETFGGSTEAAAVIADEISRVFNVRIAPAALLERGATLKRLAAIIEDELNSGPLSN
jgi:hypothetical protein